MPTRRNAPPSAARRRQHGVATLIVVMGLFFVVSLVAAYASRNLIFEQRTSANQYRSTQALEAAEAAIEWSIGLLNGGRIDDACQPSTDLAARSFRERYLQADIAFGAPKPYATFVPVQWLDGGASKDLAVACVRGGNGWACSCPAAGEPALAAPEVDGTAPAFRVTFGSGGGPGTILVKAVACTSLNNDCLVGQVASAGDARAVVNALVAVAPAMPTGPAASVTVRGDLDVGSYAWRVVNADAATNGITINAGGAFNGPNAQLGTVPGSPGGDSVVDGDPSLSGLTAGRLFMTLLGVDAATFQRLPSTLRFPCDSSCGEGLRDLVAANPGRPVWIPGDLTIDGDIVIGSPAAPALLVVRGNVTLQAAGARVHGVVLAHKADGDVAIAGSGTVQGALISTGNLSGGTAPAVVYDPEAITRVRLTQGPVVRVPGGWRDF